MHLFWLSAVSLYAKFFGMEFKPGAALAFYFSYESAGFQRVPPRGIPLVRACTLCRGGHSLLGVKASLTHSLHTQAVPVCETEPERKPLPVSKGRAFGRWEGVPRGRESNFSPLANLCFLSFRQERKGPPRPEGRTDEKKNFLRGKAAPESFPFNK